MDRDEFEGLGEIEKIFRLIEKNIIKEKRQNYKTNHYFISLLKSIMHKFKA